MSHRGGTREGSGRPKTGKTTTKATIYIKDRELLNGYAKDLDLSVNELIHQVFHDDELKNIIERIKQKQSEN
ncbi:MAG: hypothetical protein WCG23_00095 [bacterium]